MRISLTRTSLRAAQPRGGEGAAGMGSAPPHPPVQESEGDRKPSKGVTWSDSVQKRESHGRVVGGFRGREESGRPVRGQEAVRAVKRTEGKFILNTVRLRCSPRDGPAHLPAAFLRHLSQTEPYFIIFILLHD